MALEEVEVKAVQMVAAERKDSYCPGTGWRWVTGRWTAWEERVSPMSEVAEVRSGVTAGKGQREKLPVHT